jgi:hypothetical protein
MWLFAAPRWYQMHRVVVIVAAGLALGGCSSLSSAFKSEPPTVKVDLDSVPPGADALASNGQSCKTPCSITVPAADFSVAFTMNKFQPANVPVHVVVTPGDFTSPAIATADPNPVVAELQSAVPVRKRKRGPHKPKPARDGAPAAGTSPFPAPSGR